MKNLLAALTFLLLLASCADDAPVHVPQDVDNSPTINLDVLTVVVVDRSSSMVGDTPYNTNVFTPTIANAIRKWATTKLIATGTTGEAIVVIRDASLKSADLTHSDDLFTRQQTSKYIGHAEVDIDITGREGMGHVTADASHFETLPEKPSINERQNAYNKVLNALMRDLGTHMRGAIHDHIGQFVVTAPILNKQ